MTTLSVKTGAFATLERHLEGLSPRDRKLLVGLVLFAVVLGTAGFWYFLHGLLDDKASRVRDAKDSFAAVVALEQEYREADARFSSQKDRLQEYSKQPVSAYLEEVAKKHGLLESFTGVRQGTSETIGDIVQTRYTVALKKTQQEPLYRFLHELETSGFPAKVEQASFKVVVVRKERQLDLDLDITVLSLAQEG